MLVKLKVKSEKLKGGFPLLRVVFSFYFLLLTSNLIGAQAQQRPTFRSGVDLVTVEVQVVDRDGKPVPALGLPDFEVRIDGKKRHVVSATLVDYDPGSREAAAKAAGPSLASYFNKLRDRMFIIAVDEASLRPTDARVAVTAAKKFIDSLHATDYVALYKYPIISRQLDVTHGHQQVKDALDKVAGTYSPMKSGYGLSPSEIVDLMAGDPDLMEQLIRRECRPDDAICIATMRNLIPGEARVLSMYAETDAATRVHGLRLLLDALARVEGRKTLVIISGGLFTSDRTGGRPDTSSSMTFLGKEAAVANTNLYIVHLDSMGFGDVSAMPQHAPADEAAISDPPQFARSGRDNETFSLGLQQLAGTAGGGYVRVQAGTPDYAFARVLRETAAYYLLAVEPDAKERDGRLHFLRTTVKAKGATVRSRTHVFIPKK
jgi:VWFA-related protein